MQQEANDDKNDRPYGTVLILKSSTDDRILAGGRIEFEGGSDCDAFTPEDLATFYKQRRRWGTSTTANIYELIDKESCHQLFIHSIFRSLFRNF